MEQNRPRQTNPNYLCQICLENHIVIFRKQICLQVVQYSVQSILSYRMKTLKIQNYDSIFEISYKVANSHSAVVHLCFIDDPVKASLHFLFKNRAYHFTHCFKDIQVKLECMLKTPLDCLFVLSYQVNLSCLHSQLAARGLEKIIHELGKATSAHDKHVIGIQYDKGVPSQARTRLLKYLENFDLSLLLSGSTLKLCNLSAEEGSDNSDAYVLITEGLSQIGKETAQVLALRGNSLVLTTSQIINDQLQFKLYLQNKYFIDVEILELKLLESQSCSQLVRMLSEKKVTFKGIVYTAWFQAPKKTITTHGDCAAKGLRNDLLGQIDLQEKLQGAKLLTKACTITILHSSGAEDLEGISKQEQLFRLAKKEIVKEWEQHLSKKFSLSIIQTNTNRSFGLSSDGEGKLDPQHSDKTRYKRISWVIEMTQRRELSQYFRHQELILYNYSQSHHKKLCGVANQGQTIISSENGKSSQEERIQHIPEESRNKQKKKLSIVDAHYKAKADVYDKEYNPFGFVNFGLSINELNYKNIVKYFPKFLVQSDCEYKMATLEDAINQIISRQTPYTYKQACAMHTLASIIAMHAQVWQSISFEGYYTALQQIKSFSSCSIVDFQSSKCHLVFYPKTDAIEYYISLSTDKRIVIVVAHPTQVIRTQRNNVLYAFEKKYQFGFACGVCLYRDPDFSSYFNEYAFSMPLSSFLSAIIKHMEQSGLSKEDMNDLRDIEKQQNYKESYRKMFLKDTQEQIFIKNIHFSNGAGGGLVALSCSIFQKGDHVILDRPFYTMFLEDFHRAGVEFDLVDLFQRTPIQKAQSAYLKGVKGYVIANPHNPTGKVYEDSEIIELCEWAKDHGDFNLVFDEIYNHSVLNGQQHAVTAVQYANKYPNIHVVRGLSKDFSLCGFRVGVLVSSNNTVRQNLIEWKEIISPQQFVLKAVSRMLRESDWGRQIFYQTRATIKQANDATIQLLDANNIKYIPPQGGCFIILDLRDVLKEKGLTENELWMKLYYEYKVNISQGIGYYFQEEGYYRMCHIVHSDFIEEGIRRIAKMIKELPPKQKHMK